MTTKPATAPDLETAVARALPPDTRDVLDAWSHVVITTEAESQSAYAMLGWIKARLTAIHRVCDPVVQATYAAWKAARAQRETVLAPFERLDAYLREQISQFESARRRAAETDAARADPDGIVSAPPPPTAVPTRAVWSAVLVDLRAVVDAVAANQLPLDVLTVNWPVVNRMAAQHKDAFDVPGFRVERRDVPVVR
jgi:hypothetical protein